VRDIIFIEGDLERREHVDDERRRNEVDGAARVALPRRRSEGKGALVDHRRRHSDTHHARECRAARHLERPRHPNLPVYSFIVDYCPNQKIVNPFRT
jgi:hypothetical protein